MKRSNQCPKCSSFEIYSDESFSQRSAASKISISTWSQVSVVTYACLNCGLVERYIDKSDIYRKDKIAKIRTNWKKVG